VGASNCAEKVKANHQVLTNLVKTDHADVAGSLLARRADAEHSKRVQDQELFVWPWMAIVANVPAERT
jgi:AICAR transformylase/IMP cyclohydrolase PurH